MIKTIAAVLALTALPAAAEEGPFVSKAACLEELSTAIGNHDRLEYRAERAASDEGLPDTARENHATLVRNLQASADAYGEAVAALLNVCAAYD